MYIFFLLNDAHTTEIQTSLIVGSVNVYKRQPYEGAKEMLLVDDVENEEFLKNLFEAMYDELPVLKKKKK